MTDTMTHKHARRVATADSLESSSHKVDSDDDDLRLQEVGIDPSGVKRNFNIWSLLFVSFCSTVTWEAISSAMAQALLSGGSSSMIWGYVASAVGISLVALCLAEYSSRIPTAGGQYHYTFKLSPPRFRRLISWYAGWISILGWVLTCTAGIFATAMQIQSWVILFSPSYDYERWHTTLIVIGLTTFYTLLSIFNIKHLHYLISLAMFTHIFGYFATSIYLLIHVNPKNTAKYVFTDFKSLTGWDNGFVTWSIGLLSSSIGFVGWDSSAHMAEEMKHAARDLPRSMLASVVFSGILTFPWVVAIMFCITDLEGILSGPVGTISPMAQLFYNVSNGNQAATIGLTMFLPLLGIFGTGCSVISATSRIIWSFARDGALPKPFARVDSRRKVPVWSIILTWASICAFSFIYIGNDTAYYGISSACTVLLIVSYAFPILAHALYGFKYCGVPAGPFTLGRYSRVVGLAALVWCAYLTIILCFPVYLPVTAKNMNYSSLVLGFGFIAPTVGWLLYGRKYYVGVVERVAGVHEE